MEDYGHSLGLFIRVMRMVYKGLFGVGYMCVGEGGKRGKEVF